MIDTTQTLVAAQLMLIEGCRLQAYPDAGGVWTVGVGHTRGVFKGQVITLDMAEEFLKQDLAGVFSVIDAANISEPLKVLAYSSFGFNCGVGALHKVLSGLDSISNPAHTTDRKGVVLNGLLSRRRFELALLAA